MKCKCYLSKLKKLMEGRKVDGDSYLCIMFVIFISSFWFYLELSWKFPVLYHEILNITTLTVTSPSNNSEPLKQL